MSSSSSSSYSGNKNPKILKIDLDGKLYCKHDMVDVRRVVQRKSSRIGQEFYGFPLWPNMDCKFFLWKEDLDNMFREHGGEHGSCISNCMASSPSSYEDMKIKNLELKMLILQEENKRLKSKSEWKLINVLGVVFVVIVILGFCYM